MSSTASKARTKKQIATQENNLLSSRSKDEAIADNSNDGSIRRYNLRSYSPSKSKAGKSNINSKFLSNNSTKKFKAKEKIIGRVHSKNGTSFKNSANKFYLSPKSPNKLGKKNSLCNPHTIFPFKSILKNVPSPIKNSFLINGNEKDNIKERIYGPSALKQKKVTFKTMSCDNLGIFSNKNIVSEEIVQKINRYNELNDSVSNFEDTGCENKMYREEVGENENSEIIIPHTILESQEEDLNEKSFLVEKADFVFGDNMSLSYEQKWNDSQVKNNKYSNLDESPTSEALCQISPNSFKGSDNNELGDILNEEESSDKKLLDVIQNDIVPKIENFSIFSDEKNSEALGKNETFRVKNDKEKDEDMGIGSGDQASNFRSTEEENLCMNEDSSYENDLNVCEDSSENMKNSDFLSFLRKHSIAIREEGLEHLNFRDTLENNIEEKLNISIEKKDVKKKRKNKRNKLSAKCFLGNRTTENDNLAQTKFEKTDSHNPTTMTDTVHENYFQTYYEKNLKDDEFKSHQKMCSSDTKTHADLNLNCFKSPRSSRIPRILQSPVSKPVVTPEKIKTSISNKAKQSEKHLDYSYSLECEAKKIEGEIEGIRNENNGTNDGIHKKTDSMNSSFDELCVEADESRITNSNKCNQKDCYQSYEAESEEKELDHSYNKNTINSSSDNECNLNENCKTNYRNIVYDNKLNEDSGEIKKCIQKLVINPENESNNLDKKERIKESLPEEKSDITNKTKFRQKRNSKIKSSRERSGRSYFWLFFFINVILLFFLFKSLQDPFSKIKFT